MGDRRATWLGARYDPIFTNFAALGARPAPAVANRVFHDPYLSIQPADRLTIGATGSRVALPERVGVVAVPMSVFYDDRDAGRTLVRFAFCKRPEVLAEAAARLKGLRAAS